MYETTTILQEIKTSSYTKIKTHLFNKLLKYILLKLLGLKKYWNLKKISKEFSVF